MLVFLVASGDGLLQLDEDGELQRLADGRFRHLAPTEEEGTAVAVDDAGGLWQAADGEVDQFADLAADHPTCLAVDGDVTWVGTGGAHLLRLAEGEPELVEAFEHVPGRSRWHTPWGGPPEVRSLDVDDEGTLYAAVHVGGIVRGGTGGWQPTVDIDVDVHQVFTVPGRPGTVLAACGNGGLARSDDRGAGWRMSTGGLPVPYCRAVAVSGGSVLLSASAGAGGGGAALYRRPLDDEDAPFLPCGGGLPDSLAGNIDSHCVASWDEQAVVALPNGDVYLSDDAGFSWRRLRTGLFEPRAVVIV